MAGRLPVLGSSGAWPGAGHACSGYVLEHAGSRVVLDLGYGTVVPLLAHLGSDAGLGRDADLFVVECTDYSQLAEPRGEQLHLNARSAAEAARDAGARRLLLTHFWPGVDRARAAREVAEVYDGEVLVAREGMAVGL